MVPILSVVTCSLSASDLVAFVCDFPSLELVDLIAVVQGDQEMSALQALADVPSVRLLRLEKPGLSIARNFGVSVALGEWCIFPDDDCRFEPDAIANLTELLSVQDQGCGLLRIRWPEADRLPAAEFDQLTLWQQALSISSIEVVARRSSIAAIGGFDEQLGLGARYGAAEDSDLVRRLLGSSGKVSLLDSVVVHHEGASRGMRGPAAVRLRRAYSRARGYGAYLSKHGRGLPWIAAGAARLLVQSKRSTALGFPLRLAHALGRLSGSLSWRVREGAGWR